MSAIVKELYYYPIKSFRGLRADQLWLDKQGPLYDRQFVLVDDKNGFLTQRQMPELAKIGLRMLDESFIELSAAEHGEMDFGLNEHEAKAEEVTVWKRKFAAEEVNTDVSDWLSEVTKKKVRLMRMKDGAGHEFDPEKHPGRTMRFNDNKPILVISAASLKSLEAKAGVTLSMSRFRPNIVVDGIEAHVEDTWTQFSIGRVKFDGLHACSRCKITTVHPLTGEVGEEPLKTLATYRKDENGVNFGFYFTHLSEGKIESGATITF